MLNINHSALFLKRRAYGDTDKQGELKLIVRKIIIMTFWVMIFTVDKRFLDEKYTVYHNNKPIERTVKEGVMLAFDYAVRHVGKGPHGLIRMKTGDWNDQAVYGRVPITQIKTVRREGESMLNSAIAAYAFDIFAKMLEYANDKEGAKTPYQWAEDIRQAVD